MERLKLPLEVVQLEEAHNEAKRETMRAFDEQHFGHNHAKQSASKLEEDMQKVRLRGSLLIFMLDVRKHKLWFIHLLIILSRSFTNTCLVYFLYWQLQLEEFFFSKYFYSMWCGLSEAWPDLLRTLLKCEFQFPKDCSITACVKFSEKGIYLFKAFSTNLFECLFSIFMDVYISVKIFYLGGTSWFTCWIQVKRVGSRLMIGFIQG